MASLGDMERAPGKRSGEGSDVDEEGDVENSYLIIFPLRKKMQNI